MIRSALIFSLTLFMMCNALSAQAESKPIHCTFGTCQVEITSNNTFDLSCDGRATYTGTCVIHSEYRTTRIQSDTNDGPKIFAQGLPSEDYATQATLILSGQVIQGSCKVNQAEPTRN